MRILYFDTHTYLSNDIIQRISSQGSIFTKLGKSVKIEEDDDFMWAYLSIANWFICYMPGWLLIGVLRTCLASQRWSETLVHRIISGLSITNNLLRTYKTVQKVLVVFPSQARMSLGKLSLPGNNLPSLSSQKVWSKQIQESLNFFYSETSLQAEHWHCYHIINPPTYGRGTDLLPIAVQCKLE